MRNLAWIVALLLSGTVGAQSANVVELTAADSAKAESAWNALQTAQKNWDAVKDEISQQYTKVKVGDPEGSTYAGTDVPATEAGGSGLIFANGNILCSGNPILCTGGTKPPTKEEIEKERKENEQAEKWEAEHARYYRRGFENGFEFSRDFRFIVPKTPEQKAQPLNQIFYAPMTDAPYLHQESTN